METSLIILVFFIAFPLFWCAVMMLISSLSGWGSLASHYAASQLPINNRRNMRSMQMRRFRFFPANFSNMMTVAVDHDALYLSPMLMFRPFHKRLRLPFKDITIDQSPKGLRIPFWKMSDLTTKREPSIRISLRDIDVDWIEDTHAQLQDTLS